MRDEDRARSVCPNGCDLATFGTHQGPPDCDLEPADPDAILTTMTVTIDGVSRTGDVAIPSSALRRVSQ